MERCTLIPPLPDTSLCPRCTGPTRGGECWCCRAVGARLGEQPDAGPRACALTLCRQGDPLHHVLRGYKDAPAVDARRHFTAKLGSIITVCLQGNPRASALIDAADALALVPSTVRPLAGDLPPGPLSKVLAHVERLGPLHRLQVGRGPGDAGHLSPDRAAFQVDGATARRVVVMDDAWVTGSRARSWAAALSNAGAEVVGIVVASRIVDCGAAPWLAQWWLDHMADDRPAERPPPAA